MIGVSAEEARIGVGVGEFVSAFIVAACLVLVAAVLYYVSFAKMETRRAAAQAL